MSSFKDRLLTTLIADPDNSIDIQPLVIEMCGDGDGMYDNECTDCRRKIVRTLDELIAMEWISVSDNGYSFNLTAHVFDRDLGKKTYSIDPLWVRLKIKGEIEYKKSKEEPATPVTNIFTTHGDNSPIAGHDVSMTDFDKKK